MVQHTSIDDQRHWKEELVNIKRDRSDFHVSPGYRPQIRYLTMDQPTVWIRKGLQDLARNPGIAIGYGAIIALLYAAIVALTVVSGFYPAGIQLTAGFILLAPMMALGFYGISRKDEKGEAVGFADVFRAWRYNRDGVLGMGAMVVLVFLSWFMGSMWATAFLSNSAEGVAQFMGAESIGGFFSGLLGSITLPMLLGYFVVSLIALLVTFAFTAVSIPLLMDRPETDAITALTVSWEAVTRNWLPMLWWAVIIAAFTTIGLALFYVGLLITMPLLGFATWHAYRATLGEWRQVEEPKVPYY